MTVVYGRPARQEFRWCTAMPVRRSRKRLGASRARALLVTAPAYADVRNIVTAARHVTARPAHRGESRQHGRHSRTGRAGCSGSRIAGVRGWYRDDPAGLLLHLNVPAYDILRVASAIRRERYGVSSEQLDDQRAMLTDVAEVTRHLDFTWLRLPDRSPFHWRYVRRIADSLDDRCVRRWHRPRGSVDCESRRSSGSQGRRSPGRSGNARPDRPIEQAAQPSEQYYTKCDRELSSAGWRDCGATCGGRQRSRIPPAPVSSRVPRALLSRPTNQARSPTGHPWGSQHNRFDEARTRRQMPVYQAQPFFA